MTASDASALTPPGEHGLKYLAARWGLFALDHMLPATLYLMAAIGNVLLIAEIASGTGPAAGLDRTAQLWLLLQRFITTAFVCLIAILFAIRRPRAGQRSGLISDLIALSWRSRDLEMRARVKRQLWPAIAALAGTNALVLASLAPVTETSPQFVIPGTIVGAIGLVFSLIALAFLGRCFGVFPEARGLVRRGPYARIRHPLYLAEIISAFGWLLINLSAYTLALLVLFVGLQYWRAIYEERALTSAFPEYDDYRQHSWRILPGIH